MKYWNWILPLAVATAIVMIVFLYVIPVRENERDLKINEQWNALKTSNELLKKDNLELTLKMDRATIEADSLSQLIRQDSTAIQTLKKARHDKVDAINDFSDDALFQFFATFGTDRSATE